MRHACEHWRRQFRGVARIKDDKDVSDADIAAHNLILWGDPASNAILARIAGKLPIRWTTGGVQVGQESFSAGQHVPVLIYPNPLSPSKYVVVNSGLDINDAGYNGDYGTPMWGDYAVVKVKPGADMPDLQMGGLFDENWKLVP